MTCRQTLDCIGAHAMAFAVVTGALGMLVFAGVLGAGLRWWRGEP